MPSGSAHSLVSVDRQYLYSSLDTAAQGTWESVLTKDESYRLFHWEDWPAWVCFTCAFMFLICVDNFVLCRNPQAMTISKAVLYTMFWIFTACAFCSWVYMYYGPNQAFMWMSGYMLEWMLSFDNLFVFHMIFTIYGCPDHLKHRPLFLGICGAVFFRLIFIFVGEYLMHSLFFMHFIFGGFLVWTGVKTVTGDDEDEDPSQHPLVQLLTRHVPFIPAYDSAGRFFVRVPLDDKGEADLPAECRRLMVDADSADETTAIVSTEAGQQAEEGEESSRRSYGTVVFPKPKESQKTELRATMLFLVVCCLEISDILFAVDSVSAIVAQVNDLFLAYTSAVFAMLGLRATFFIIDVLVRLFSLLKYGVGAVLVFVGMKLIVSKWYHCPPGIVCMVLVTAIATSMVASVIKDDLEKKSAGKGEQSERVAKALEAATKSPMPGTTAPRSPMPAKARVA